MVSLDTCSIHWWDRNQSVSYFWRLVNVQLKRIWYKWNVWKTGIFQKQNGTKYTLTIDHWYYLYWFTTLRHTIGYSFTILSILWQTSPRRLCECGSPPAGEGDNTSSELKFEMSRLRGSACWDNRRQSQIWWVRVIKQTTHRSNVAEHFAEV